MNRIDFISEPLSIYFMNEKNAQSKLGGFFSIIFLLTIVGISIYYLYAYFEGNSYNIKYYHDNVISLQKEEMNIIYNSSIEFLLLINKTTNYGNCKIHLFLKDEQSIYNETTIPKCNDKYKVDPELGDLFYINFSLITNSLLFGFEGNCTDLNGNSYEIKNRLFSQMIKINHKEEEPFIYSTSLNSFDLKNYASMDLPLYTTKNEIHYENLEFIPIIYKTTKKLRIFKNKNLILNIGRQFGNINNLNLKSINRKIVDNNNIDIFFVLTAEPSVNIDVYEREYSTLIDVLAAIGGLFSPIKLFFSILAMSYSSYENNYQIAKNIILKKRIYENYAKKKVEIDKNIELKIEKSLSNRKNKLNSCEHYFCSIFRCFSKRKTMKILNLCDNFVKEYLSADNIIFNSILIESYFKENSFDRTKQNIILKEIEKEIFNIEKEIYNSNQEDIYWVI